MRNLTLVIFIFFSCSILNAETDSTENDNFLVRYVNSLLNDTSKASEDKFVVYPFVGYTPETNVELGISSLYIYYANKDTNNRLSQFRTLSFYTLEDQFGIWLIHSLYSDMDKWYFLGDIRFQNFPLNFNGVGPDTQAEVIGNIEGRQITISERVFRRVDNDLFLGIGLDFQDIHNPIFNPENGYTENYRDSIIGIDGSSNFGLGAGILYDNRQNILNVRDGFYSELSFLKYSNALGSDFDFTFINTDIRYYTSVSENNVLAAQVFGQFNTGSVPFNQLALLGGETIMRGYYRGRYRDKNQLAAQLEFRMLPLELGFTDRLGLAFFGSAGTVFPNFNELKANNVLFSGGAGLRFLLFPKKDVYVRIDAAFTGEGTGFYLWMGESF